MAATIFFLKEANNKDRAVVIIPKFKTSILIQPRVIKCMQNRIFKRIYSH
jgi:hypothetical protein